jgi:molecular chaperone DnaK
MVQDMGAKLAPSDKAAVESAIEALKTAMNSNDTAGMNKAMEQLTQAQHRAAEALYKQAGSAAGSAGAEGAPGPEGAGSAGSAASPGGGGAGDVIDAEVVDEEKR